MSFSACRSARVSLSLFEIDRSMLMRSMAFVYSPMRGSGMTTSSLILNALVWRAMAAVLARSAQKAFRASGETAMKPSPERPLASRMTSEDARATAASSSPTRSPMRTILGITPRLLLVE